MTTTLIILQLLALLGTCLTSIMYIRQSRELHKLREQNKELSQTAANLPREGKFAIIPYGMLIRLYQLFVKHEEYEEAARMQRIIAALDKDEQQQNQQNQQQ